MPATDDDTLLPFSLPSICQKKVTAAFDGGRISSDGGVLLLAGRRREGLLAAATGTALALLDQQDMLRKWWTILPEYIGDVQRLLDQTQSAVEEFSTQRQKLGEVLGRQRN